MWDSFNDYTKKNDFKVFAATSSSDGGDAYATGRSWNHDTVAGAVERALAGCDTNGG
jgi:hypothetical protein